jgi:hypothetical protein
MKKGAKAKPKTEREEEVSLKILLANAEVLLHDALFFYTNGDIPECTINLDEAIGAALIARNRMGKAQAKEENE